MLRMACAVSGMTLAICGALEPWASCRSASARRTTRTCCTPPLNNSARPFWSLAATSTLSGGRPIPRVPHSNPGTCCASTTDWRDRAELPKIRFHDLRHSAATILKAAGIPDEAIQKLLGHASVRTTHEVYTHLTVGGEKRAAAKMDEVFGPVAVTVADKTAFKERVEPPS